MNQLTAVGPAVTYPENDGNPMSDNTLQFRWIVTIQGGLDALFRDNPDVFVAGDLLWYPVQGDNTTRQAPDAMVAFGRPKGDRGSYRQWEENGVAPQVVFEVLSPGNRPGEMARKLLFYEQHGVEEYYIYDPDRVRLTGYRRSGDGGFEQVPEMNGFTSPRLGIRFDMSGPELTIYRPDGRPFQTYLELSEQAEWERTERQRIEQEVERLKARLRAAGIDPDAAGS
jgi:Uma2 family endonuclease